MRSERQTPAPVAAAFRGVPARRNAYRSRTAALVALAAGSGLMIAGPALGQAADPESAAPAAIAPEAAAPGATVAANEGSAYALGVSGGPVLSARPGARARACPDDQAATLPSASLGSLLTTGPLDVRVACEAEGALRSRAVATNVVLAPNASAGLLSAKVVAGECTVEGGVPKGGAVIGGLSAGGRAIGDLKNVESNTDLSTLAPGLTGVINERIEADGRLTINAMRVKLGAVEVVMGHVECGKGAAAAGVKGGGSSGGSGSGRETPAGEEDGEAATGAKADKKDPATATTVAGAGKNDPAKVTDKGKDKGKPTTSVARPTTTRPVPTTAGRAVTTTTKAAAVTGKGGRGDLARTGPVTGALLALAAGALGLGALMRAGGNRVASGSSAPAPAPVRHQPASGWATVTPRKSADTTLDGPARDAMRQMAADPDA
ncbi:MAG: hypothetical protein ACT4OS_02825 [Acidimicrobiales bacterium]